MIACSALKERYREILSNEIKSGVEWVFLRGYFDLIHERMKKRVDHFMPTALLKNQFDTLEAPKKCIRINIEKSENAIIKEILRKLQ